MIYLLLALPATTKAAPEKAIKSLQEALIASTGFASFDERVESLSPIVIQTHDFSAIARLVTGRHWRKLEAQQHEQFINVFTQLSVMTYAERFKDLAQSKFNYIETLEQPRNSIKIISTLELDPNAQFSELTDKRLFNFEYILQAVTSDDEATSEQWKIINVIVDGVSDLALKRSNYVSILNDHGFDGLMTELSKKINKIQENSSAN